MQTRYLEQSTYHPVLVLVVFALGAVALRCTCDGHVSGAKTHSPRPYSEMARFYYQKLDWQDKQDFKWSLVNECISEQPPRIQSINQSINLSKLKKKGAAATISSADGCTRSNSFMQPEATN